MPATMDSNDLKALDLHIVYLCNCVDVCAKCQCVATAINR